MPLLMIKDLKSDILEGEEILQARHHLYFPQVATLRVEDRGYRISIVQEINPSKRSDTLGQNSSPITALSKYPISFLLAWTKGSHCQR